MQFNVIGLFVQGVLAVLQQDRARPESQRSGQQLTLAPPCEICVAEREALNFSRLGGTRHPNDAVIGSGPGASA